MEGFFTDTLRAGRSLSVNQELTSFNGKHRLVYQEDGNLVGYDADTVIGNDSAAKAFFATGALSPNPGKVVLHGDGNLVCYDARGQPYWASNSTGRSKGPYSLVMQNDRDICIYDSVDVLTWSSGTSMEQKPASQHGHSEPFSQRNTQVIDGKSEQFRLALHGGRPFGSYVPGVPSLASGAHSDHPHAGTSLGAQSRAGLNIVQMCFDASGKPLWTSVTRGIGGSVAPFRLVTQDARSALMYAGAASRLAAWAPNALLTPLTSSACMPLNNSTPLMGTTKTKLVPSPSYRPISDSQPQFNGHVNRQVIGYKTGDPGSSPKAIYEPHKWSSERKQAAMLNYGNCEAPHAAPLNPPAALGVVPPSLGLVVQNGCSFRSADGKMWETHTHVFM